MKLAIITSRFPFPIEKGDKLRVYHQLKELAQYHEIYLISITDNEVETEHLAHIRQFCKEIFIFKQSKFTIFFNLVQAFFNKIPLQVGYFYNKTIAEQIKQTLISIKVDHIYCQLIRTALYIEDINTTKTIDYMDAFSIGMKRRAERSFWIWKSLFRYEAKLLAAFEKKVFNWFDHHTIISDQDRQTLSFKEKESIQVIPNGVDVQFFQPNSKKRKQYDLAFVGNMGYYPNVMAAQYLVKKIMPLLSPKTTLLLAGARPTTEVQALNKGNVTVSGWLEDICDAYYSAKIIVTPIFQGSGQQNKILEAMALGIPCITTSLVNNAIGAKPDIEILIADSPEEFSIQIEKLLTENELLETIAINARKFVVDNFSWKKAVEELNQIFKSN